MTIRRSTVGLLCSVLIAFGCEARPPAEIQRVTSGPMEIVLLSARGNIQHGKDSFIVEFRSNGALVDVGDVKASATMPMPGMPMFGTLDVGRGDLPGRYVVSSDFSMAGSWRLTLEWNGSRGSGTVSLSSSVQ